MHRRLMAVLVTAVLIPTTFLVMAGAGARNKSAESRAVFDDVQKQLDDMKASFDKLSDEKDKLADQLRALSKAHTALKSRYETTAKDATDRLVKLEGCNSCDRLTSLETTRTEHGNRLGAIETKTAFLYVTPTAPGVTSLGITMGKKKFLFQGDGNAIVLGEKGTSIWHTDTWQQGR